MFEDIPRGLVSVVLALSYRGPLLIAVPNPLSHECRPRNLQAFEESHDRSSSMRGAGENLRTHERLPHVPKAMLSYHNQTA